MKAIRLTQATGNKCWINPEMIVAMEIAENVKHPEEKATRIWLARGLSELVDETPDLILAMIDAAEHPKEPPQ